MSKLYATLGKADELQADLMDQVAQQVFITPAPDIRTQAAFNRRKQEGNTILLAAANTFCDLVYRILKSYSEIQGKIANANMRANTPAMQDIHEHLSSLIFAGFVRATPAALLQHYPRYLDAVKKRMEKVGYAPARDELQLNKLAPWWRDYVEIAALNKKSGNLCPELETYRFMLEEYRVSLFAQELGTVISVSPERLHMQREALRKEL
jgi:ATP-dependent helicase HrpA